jgi:hypothetical protein
MTNKRLQKRAAPFAAAFIRIMFILMWLAGWLPAATSGEAQNPASEPSPAVGAQDTNETASRTVNATLPSVPRFLQNMRKSVGFSVGVSETYAPKAVLSSQRESVALRFTSLNPRLFANVRRQRYQLFFDYTFGFRTYARYNQINGHAHATTLDFERVLSPRLTLRVTEAFMSSFNDSGTVLASSPNLTADQTVIQDLDVPRQRLTRSALSISVSSRVSRRGNISVFGGHELWRYSSLALGGTDAVLAGVQGSYQINRFLFLDSRYSQYLNAVNERFRRNDIHRLEFASLRFRSRRGWDLSLGSGIEFARFQGNRQTAAGVQTKIAKTSESNQFSFTYHRGLSAVVGQSAVLGGNQANLSFGRLLLPRVNLEVSSSYLQSSSSRNDELKYVLGRAQLGIAVQRHILLSADYWYVSQRLSNTTMDIPGVSRYAVSLGVQYFLPALAIQKAR